MVGTRGVVYTGGVYPGCVYREEYPGTYTSSENGPLADSAQTAKVTNPQSDKVVILSKGDKVVILSKSDDSEQECDSKPACSGVRARADNPGFLLSRNPE